MQVGCVAGECEPETLARALAAQEHMPPPVALIGAHSAEGGSTLVAAIFLEASTQSFH